MSLHTHCRRSLTVVITLLALMPFPALANAPIQVATAPKATYEQALKASSRLQKADRAINDVFQALMKRLDKPARSRLVDDELGWIRDRDGQCQPKMGQLADYAECLAEQSEARTKDLAGRLAALDAPQEAPPSAAASTEMAAAAPKTTSAEPAAGNGEPPTETANQDAGDPAAEATPTPEATVQEPEPTPEPRYQGNRSDSLPLMLARLWLSWTNLSEMKHRQAQGMAFVPILPTTYDPSGDHYVLWPESQVVSVRTWRNAPLADSPHENFLLSLATFGCDDSQRNLNLAYRMGLNGHPYHLVFFNPDDPEKWRLVATSLDATSLLLYGVTWLVNTPQKAFRQIAYVTMPGNDSSYSYLLDMILGAMGWGVDACLAIVVTVVGGGLALLVHPITSLASIGGFLYFLVPLIFSMVVGTFLSLWYMVLSAFWSLAIVLAVVVILAIVMQRVSRLA